MTDQGMLFDELYSAYYNAVAEILKRASERPVTRQEVREIVEERAFSESILAIEPALFEGQWQLLCPDGTAPLMRGPNLPLTLLEKRWLKAILLDPRVRLFDCELKGLEEVEPLFLPDDIHIFDKYADGDPYDNEKYIQNFRTIMDAIAARCPLRIDVENRRGMSTHIKAIPEYMEYSEKDDKFRLITSGCRYGRTINLARILSCRPCPLQDEDAVVAACGKRNGEAHTGSNGKRSGDLCGTSRESAGAVVCGGREREVPEDNGKKRMCPPQTESLVFELFDGRNALERALLHFAHFEKEAERLEQRRYRVRIHYSREDETELVIRVLSFGPFLRVTEPARFIGLIRERLKRQRELSGKPGAEGRAEPEQEVKAGRWNNPPGSSEHLPGKREG